MTLTLILQDADIGKNKILISIICKEIEID